MLDEQDFFEQHNNFRDVSSQPGNLLCCATCNLIFHMDCTQPRLEKEPSDDWSCVYCCSDGIKKKKSKKDQLEATKAYTEMKRMTLGKTNTMS